MILQPTFEKQEFLNNNHYFFFYVLHSTQFEPNIVFSIMMSRRAKYKPQNPEQSLIKTVAKIPTDLTYFVNKALPPSIFDFFRPNKNADRMRLLGYIAELKFLMDLALDLTYKKPGKSKNESQVQPLVFEGNVGRLFADIAKKFQDTLYNFFADCASYLDLTKSLELNESLGKIQQVFGHIEDHVMHSHGLEPDKPSKDSPTFVKTHQKEPIFTRQASERTERISYNDPEERPSANIRHKPSSSDQRRPASASSRPSESTPPKKEKRSRKISPTASPAMTSEEKLFAHFTDGSHQPAGQRHIYLPEKRTSGLEESHRASSARPVSAAIKTKKSRNSINGH